MTTEKKLITEKDILKALEMGLEYGLAVQDREYNVIYQNDLLRNMFGDKPGKCYQRFEFRNSICDGCPIEKTFSDGKPHDSERTVNRKDGQVLTLKNTSLPIRNADGDIIACLEIVRDITAWKRAESDGLRASLLDNLPGAAFRCRNDSQRTMEYLSHGCKALFGHPPIEYFSDASVSYADLIHPDDLQQVLDTIQSALAERTPYQIAYRIRTIQGEEKWVWEKASGISGLSGEIVAIEGFIADITEQKHMEEALRNSETKYRILVENFLASVYIIQDGLFRFVNRKFCETTGYSYDEIVDKLSPLDFAVGASKTVVSENIRKRMEGQIDSVRYTINFRKKDGEIRIVDIMGTAINYNGRTAILGTMIDITDQKRAEEELKKQEEFLSSVVENIPNMLFIKEAKDLKFIRFNRAGEDLLGYKQKDLIGKNDYDFFPRDQADFFRQKDREVLATGRICDIPEERIDTKSGPRILHTTKMPILDDTGNPEFLLVISEDITVRKQEEKEREQLQAQLAQAQKMESVGRLAGGVAHDFNNMLGAILGYTELAMEHIATDSPFFAYLSEIKKAAVRSADLTRQLLAFARKQTITPEVLDLNEIVDGMLKMLRRLIGEDINLIWRPATDLLPVKIDPSQIDQILANLCVNARDAIAGVGQIIIETRQIFLDAPLCSSPHKCMPGEYVLLSISDNGCGMTKETIGMLFEPFFTTKAPGKGTGLGLSIVYGIVAQNNGAINVHSEPGNGTTFKIYLPYHKQQRGASTVKEKAADIPTGHETILIVEDEAIILEMTRLLLEQLGYRVLCAHLPNEALSLAEMHDGKIDLFMTDVIMPQMNGKDLSEKIAVIRPGIKCLFCSGYTGEIIDHQGIIEGNLHFIQKPFSIRALSVKIREVLGDAP